MFSSINTQLPSHFIYIYSNYILKLLFILCQRKSANCSDSQIEEKMLHKIVNVLSSHDENKKKMIGKVVLMKKNVLDFNDFSASIIDNIDELLGKKVSLQLVSEAKLDPGQYSHPLTLSFFLTKRYFLYVRSFPHLFFLLCFSHTLFQWDK